MTQNAKLRMSVGLFYPIAMIFCYIMAIAEWAIRAGLVREGMDIRQMPLFTYYICAAFFLSMGIFQWFKYRLWVYPVIGFLVGLLCTMAPSLIIQEYIFPKPAYFITFFILALIVVLNWPALYAQERFEINTRRLFRLAAALIYETTDGYTERPFSAGEIDFPRGELVGFARFLEGKYVARVFHEGTTLFLAFSLNKSIVTVKNPREVSHIMIPESGSMTIFITGSDYRQYRKTYDFNQLCHSLGEVFKRFMAYYQQGLESRIITELKASR